MDETRKRRSLIGLMSETGETLRDVVVNQPLAWWAEARVKMRDLPKTNFDLGCTFAEQGKWFDAIFRFRIVLYLQPNYPHAQYNLGCCYFRTGKRAEASAALRRAVQQDPTHQEALFMLAAIDPGALPPTQRPQHMPKAMVTQFFTSIAAGYDGMEAQNQYKGGQLVFDQLRPLLTRTELEIVDLGCGTGIAARPWRSAARTITGVDMTPAMVGIAADIANDTRRLFDRVIEADIAALGDSLPAGQADLVLAVNAVQFVGELGGVLSGAARLLKADGLFAITVEPYTGGSGFGLSAETGRFGHSPAYVKQQASAAGLTLAKEARLPFYPGSNVDLLIFSKGSH